MSPTPPRSREPDDLGAMRASIEAAVPHGRTDNGGRNDRGAWHDVPARQAAVWSELAPGWAKISSGMPGPRSI